MNRSRTDERRVESYRTVTEISDADSLYKKKFEVGDLVDKNEAYQREKEKREMYLMLSKYVAMVLDLKLPDLKILFGSNSNTEHLLSLVYHSLAFVNNQMFPHSTKFVDMKFVVVTERKMAIPGEPIVFYKSINPDDQDQTVTCFVDRPGILRVLEKPVDVNLVFEESDCKTEVMSRLLDRIKQMEQRKYANPYECFVSNEFMSTLNEFNFKMEESYITQFVILLILFTNAYLGYYKLIRTDFQQYLDFLMNHESLIKENTLTNLPNLFTSKFIFSVQGEHEKKSASGLIFKKFE
jgi:hypothetical protein